MSSNRNKHLPTALLTGPNGFLGKYLATGLREAGYQVLGMGRTAGDLVCDLATEQPDLSGKSIRLVVHSAGKAHTIPQTEAESQAFFQVNQGGTDRLLQALDKAGIVPDAFVLISTVAVYGCETGESITEDAPLNGQTPYAESKRLAEDLVVNWCHKQGVRCAVLRLPLIVGNQAPGNLGTLTRAIRRGRYVHIGNGTARRSMVRADDVARIIPKAARIGGIYNLTDGVHPTVRELAEAIAQRTAQRPIPTIPIGLARFLARVGDGIGWLLGRRFPFDSVSLTKITGSLTFSDQRARQQLDWRPRSVGSFFASDQALPAGDREDNVSSVSVSVS
ncbi:NAD-dependent epimerase/dehydratase family protein [Larkinella rosea]|uniref:NAD-dependent epimerase/dehydratase family protein n=1 Tax=Larkinella rosea TaxID=2025312 RepID=A0A3P1BIF7_9BACT|nr:NAD-dependent epimerase/dehydratase family protein [Larkinella rosea]RRB00887.1 NAD-dependent epimerase/dehydratase family protein [Larkinella rosea]